MNERPNGPVDDELLAAFVEGELSGSERAAIGAALSDDPSLRQRVAGLERVRDALVAPVAELEGLDLTEAVRARIEAPERSLSRRGALLGGASLAAAAALWVAASVPSKPDESRAFGAKGSSLASRSVERWTAVQVHRARDAGPPELAMTSVRRTDALLFSYTNRSDAPFAYLMIFGVDPGGAVFWFYPGYERAGEDPRSTPIRAGVVGELLPDVVRHELAAGPLAVHALFTRRPLGVLAVEAWIAARRENASAAPPGEGHLQTIELDVTP
jgi:hypothetical protein